MFSEKLQGSLGKNPRGVGFFFLLASPRTSMNQLKSQYISNFLYLMLSIPIDLIRKLKYHISAMKYLRSAKDDFWLASGTEKAMQRKTPSYFGNIYLKPLNLIFDPTKTSKSNVSFNKILSSTKSFKLTTRYSRLVKWRSYHYTKNKFYSSANIRIFVWYDENSEKNIFAKIGCSAKSAFSQKRAKSPREWVFFLMLATSEISEKKPHPPGAFAEIPL